MPDLYRFSKRKRAWAYATTYIIFTFVLMNIKNARYFKIPCVYYLMNVASFPCNAAVKQNVLVNITLYIKYMCI